MLRTPRQVSVLINKNVAAVPLSAFFKYGGIRCVHFFPTCHARFLLHNTSAVRFSCLPFQNSTSSLAMHQGGASLQHAECATTLRVTPTWGLSHTKITNLTFRDLREVHILRAPANCSSLQHLPKVLQNQRKICKMASSCLQVMQVVEQASVAACRTRQQD